MTIYDLKPRFQMCLRPSSDWLAMHRVTPNMVTIGALVLSIAQGVILGLFHRESWPLLMLPLILFVRMTLNAIDGMIAREHSMQSVSGMFLNEAGDIVSDLALYMPFLLVLTTPFALWLFAAFLIGTAISETVGILAISVGGIRRYDGPMGKSDRAFAISALAIILALLGEHAILVNVYASVICILVWRTVYHRYLRSIDDQQKGVRI